MRIAALAPVAMGLLGCAAGPRDVPPRPGGGVAPAIDGFLPSDPEEPAHVAVPDAAVPDATPPLTSASVLARLPVRTGAVPGAPALVVHSRLSRLHCGGVRVWVTGRRPPELAAALTLEWPRGLDFEPGGPRRRRSERRFRAWIDRAQAARRAAIDRYRAGLGGAAAPPVARAQAYARAIQVNRRFAELLARSEISVELRRDPRASAAFCDAVAEWVAPFVREVDDLAEGCRAQTTEPGWWTEVCTAPGRPAP